MSKLFLDSGAFSAWTLGVEIDIGAYCEFIKEYMEFFEVYANLDVIGDAEGTYKNQKAMEKRGLLPLPVYHTRKEDPEWLGRYVKEGYEYVALGGMSGETVAKRDFQKILDELWLDWLTDKDGFPIVRVHGFGLTAIDLVLRYPWYSVDSSAWSLAAAMGDLYFPRFEKGDWVFGKQPVMLSVSSRSPANKIKGMHIESLGEADRETAEECLAKWGFVIGKSLVTVDNEGEVQEEIIEPGLCNSYRLRHDWNSMYFSEMSKVKGWPSTFEVGDILEGFLWGQKSTKKLSPMKRKKLCTGRYRTYLAAVPDEWHTEKIVKWGGDVLLSYHYIKSMKPERLRKMFTAITTGRFEDEF